MLLAADNLSAARPSVRRAILAEDGAFLADLCRRLSAAGAAWLDLNPGPLPAARREAIWRFLVATAEAACDLTLLLDAPEPATLARALTFCTRPPVLNLATAEPARLRPLLELARTHGLGLVAATMTATVPPTCEERLALAALIVAEADGAGLPRQRLILDPMVLPLGLPAGEAHAGAVLAFLRQLPLVFDPRPRTLLALSNLTTRTAGAETGFAAAPFLAAAFGAGLDIALVNVLDPGLRPLLRLLPVLNGERIFAPAEHRA